MQVKGELEEIQNLTISRNVQWGASKPFLSISVCLPPRFKLEFYLASYSTHKLSSEFLQAKLGIS